MKTAITRLCIIVSGIFILLSFQYEEALLKFFLIGEIPGTGITLSPNAMLVLFAAVLIVPLVVSVSHLRTVHIFHRLARIKARMPKRRYSSLS